MRRDQCAGRLLVELGWVQRRIAVALTFDTRVVLHQPRPTGKTILARDHQLRVGQCGSRGSCDVERGVLGAGASYGDWITDLEVTEQRLRCFAVEREAGPRGERAQFGHEASFREWPVSACWAEKRCRRIVWIMRQRRTGQSLPADWMRSDSAPRRSHRGRVVSTVMHSGGRQETADGRPLVVG